MRYQTTVSWSPESATSTCFKMKLLRFILLLLLSVHPRMTKNLFKSQSVLWVTRRHPNDEI